MAPPRDRSNSEGHKLVASNRRAHRDYDILETFETGIVLSGSEVKSPVSYTHLTLPTSDLV